MAIFFLDFLDALPKDLRIGQGWVFARPNWLAILPNPIKNHCQEMFAHGSDADESSL